MTIQQDGEIRILGERYLAVLFAGGVTEVNTSSRSIDCLALRRHRTPATAEAACCQTEGLCGFGHVIDVMDGFGFGHGAAGRQTASHRSIRGSVVVLKRDAGECIGLPILHIVCRPRSGTKKPGHD
ncbi:hypothetical protein QL093DRAFT_2085986 [Fusarium oxysporum]|nr:hypothetical protein QL093DRAFT_2085986 [Fusarium oxysporum]